MKTWKRNAIVAAVLVLVCGGIWLNWRYEEAHATELVSTLDREKVLDEAALVLAPTEEGLEALANEPAGDGETAAETFASRAGTARSASCRRPSPTPERTRTSAPAAWSWTGS